MAVSAYSPRRGIASSTSGGAVPNQTSTRERRGIRASSRRGPGSILAWHPHLLHGGGACAPDAPPRISAGIYFRGEGRSKQGTHIPFDAPLPFASRLHLIAAALLRYQKTFQFSREVLRFVGDHAYRPRRLPSPQLDPSRGCASVSGVSNVSPQSRFCPADDVVFRNVDGETVILSIGSGLYFGLTPEGTRIGSCWTKGCLWAASSRS